MIQTRWKNASRLGTGILDKSISTDPLSRIPLVVPGRVGDFYDYSDTELIAEWHDEDEGAPLCPGCPDA